ncbi:unnamed protein product [Eruca vesicaria subsp. sativa]|uniref:F-box domain-containing protein n=1 Tax=Eruca vesicaria subsp. sativa TaxID=29727 RepID=A0ABC8IX27_ERUVS|nr:unnamed protein product [Eruca vesicaria subsp. sativa]
MTSAEVKPTKKKNKVPEPPLSFSSLPDELTENILARVSRWKYASLSLVSKRFHSLLSSKEIYRTRSQIGATETCVYVWLKLPDHPCASWFSLRTKPNYQNRTKQRGKIRFKRGSSGLSVEPIPSSSTDSFPEQNNITTFGPEIYIIGGRYKPSSSVRIFDCRSHTWRDAPNMTVARKNAPLPGPGADEDELRNHLRKSSEYVIVNEFEGKLYVATDEKEFSYEPKNGKWKLVRETSSLISDSIDVLCEMGNVIYGCTDLGYLMWSAPEMEGRKWREIKGLEKLRKHPTRGLEIGCEFGLVGYGGQLLVMWDTYIYKRYNKIWCAKISLESRRNGREVWGKVECVDLLTFPVKSYERFGCVAASI